jgi:DNA-directed RNA polymerase specialized sigma24 family protein
MSMYSLHFFTEGPSIEARLSNARFQYLLHYHAQRLAYSARGQGGDVQELHQDLFQEGMLAAFRILERMPGLYGRDLLRLAVLAMYAARRRGRSVFRADPWRRSRSYEQVSLDALPDGAQGVQQWSDLGQLIREAEEEMVLDAWEDLYAQELEC